MRCPGCGKVIPNGIARCAYCGANAQAKAVSPGRKRSSRVVWTGMILVLLAVGGGYVVLSLLHNSRNQNRATPIPHQDGMQLLYTLAGHGRAYSVAFSPDGALLASEWDDETVRVWNVSDWALRYTLEGDAGYATLVGFSSDGSELISVSGDCYSNLDLQIHFWDADTGKLLQTLPLADSIADVRCQSILTLSPDGEMLAYASTEGMIKIRRLSDGSQQQILQASRGWTNSLFSLAFSEDRSMLASGEREGVRLWRLSDEALLRTLQASYPVDGVAFSPDGALVASGGESTVEIWRVADGALLRTMHLPQGTPKPISFSPDGTVLAASSTYALGTGDVHLWRVSDGALLGVLDGPSGPVNDLAFSPDSSLLAWTTDDGTVQVWRVR